MRFSLLFLIGSFFLFSLPAVSANNLTDALDYWDFEDIISPYNSSYPNGVDNNDGFATDSVIFTESKTLVITDSVIGDYAVQSYYPYGVEQTINGNGWGDACADNTQGNVSYHCSLSLWFRISGSDNITHPVIGTRGSSSINFGSGTFLIDQNDYPVLLYTQSNATGGWVRFNTSIAKDTWYHAVIAIREADTSYDSDAIDLYLNGTNITKYNASGEAMFVTGSGTYQTLIGESLISGGVYGSGGILIENYTLGLPSADIKPIDTTNEFRLIEVDEVGVWGYYFNQSEVDSLYNNGTGFNPFNPADVSVDASIPEQYIARNAVTTIDFTNYFSSATGYSGQSTCLVDGVFSVETVSTTNASSCDAFTLAMYDSDTLTILCKSTVVQDQSITITGTNADSSASTSFLFNCGSSQAQGTLDTVSVIKPDNAALYHPESVSYDINDYFVGETTTDLFYVFAADYTSGTWDIYGAGDTGSTNCVSITNNGFRATFTSTADDCENIIRFGLYREDGYAYTQTFRVDVYNTTTPLYAAGDINTSTFTGRFLSLFPADASQQEKFSWVFVSLLAIILIVGWIAYESGHTTMPIVVGVMASIFAIVFFTSIGYIPLWMVFVPALLLLFVVIGKFRSGVLGGF